jgi:hypothetical protein
MPGKTTTRPTAEAAALRLVILKFIVVSAIIAPPRNMLRQMMSKWGAEERANFERQAEIKREEMWQGIHKAGWWPHLSPKEQAHARCTIVTMTQQQQADASWRMEAVQVLMWALGLLPALPPYDTMASHDLLKRVPPQIGPFIQAAQLREQAEIDEARNIAEFWHWRSRTRQLIERGDAFPANPQMKAAGLSSYDDAVRFSARQAAETGTIPPCLADDFPAKGKAYRDLTAEEWSEVRSITAERHFALNWLCGYAPDNKWDETPTST